MKLCACCFKDEEIRQFINVTSKETGTCDYCAEDSKLLDVEELLDFFVDFTSIFKPEASGNTLIETIQNDWNLFSDTIVGSAIMSDILSMVDSDLSAGTEIVYISEISGCVDYWGILKESVKWERRFLTNAEKLDDYGWSSLFTVNAEIDSRISLFRSRIHHDGAMICISPSEMGAPPQRLTTAGRANPQGIPYLYLSKLSETTLYEIRATYLDILTVGCFVVSGDPIRIVDFTSKPSPFNYMGNMIDLAKSSLLKESISKDLSKPLRRFDSELEYIPTQFICEFIRYSTGSDGIQFNSSLHKGGVNIVLFDPGKVKCIGVELHQITDVQISSEIL